MNKDFINQKISYYRFWLTFFVTIDAAMVAWFFEKLKELNLVILTSFSIGVILATILAYIMNIKIRRAIKRLGEQNA